MSLLLQVKNREPLHLPISDNTAPLRLSQIEAVGWIGGLIVLSEDRWVTAPHIGVCQGCGGFVGQWKRWCIGFVCEQKCYWKTSHLGVSYQSQMEAEWRGDTGDTKDKLCSAEGHILKWLLLKCTIGEATFYSCCIIVFHFPHHSDLSWTWTNQVFDNRRALLITRWRPRKLVFTVELSGKQSPLRLFCISDSWASKEGITPTFWSGFGECFSTVSKKCEVKCVSRSLNVSIPLV